MFKLVKNNKVALVTKALNEGADMNEVDPKSGNSLLHACVAASSLQLLEWLLDSGLDLNIRNLEGLTSLELAIKLKELDAFKLLIRKGNLESSSRAELIAAETPDAIYLSMLITTGGNLKARDSDGGLLHHAIISQNIPVVQFLLHETKGMDYKITDDKGQDIIDISIEKGMEEILVMLAQHAINNGADDLTNIFRKRDNKGSTLFHRLAERKALSALKALVKLEHQLGISVETRNNQNQTYDDLINAHKSQTLEKTQDTSKDSSKIYHPVQTVPPVRIPPSISVPTKRKLKIEPLPKEENLLSPSAENQPVDEQKRKFFCILFIVAVFVLLYFYTKMRIAAKGNYIIG